MFVDSLLRSSRHRSNRKPIRRPRRSLKAQVTILEDRTVLSMLVVCNNLDSGLGSLRNAIVTAGGGDTIVFAPSLDGQTIKLTSGDLLVNKNLNIVGPVAGAITVSGNDASRVFDVASGATATISNLKIVDGMVDTPLETTPSIATWGGGGILNEPGATLTLVHDTLSNNQAVGVAGQDEFGGGLFNLGTATVSGCTFMNNQVLGAGSYDIIGGPSGGAIENYGGATVTVVGSLFSKNSVVSAAGTGYFANGGAINTDAGVNGATPSTANVSDCTFLGNYALAGAQNDGNGGALNTEPGSSMTLTDCLISGSRSVGGEGGVGIEMGQGIGGGIFNDGGTMVIAGCTITDNLAGGGNNGNLSDIVNGRMQPQKPPSALI